MQPEHQNILIRLLKGLGWVAAFLIIVCLGAFTTCMAGGFLGDLVDKKSPRYGKGLEGAGNTILFGLIGMVVGGIATAATFEHFVRKRIKRAKAETTDTGENS